MFPSRNFFSPTVKSPSSAVMLPRVSSIPINFVSELNVLNWPHRKSHPWNNRMIHCRQNRVVWTQFWFPHRQHGSALFVTEGNIFWTNNRATRRRYRRSQSWHEKHDSHERLKITWQPFLRHARNFIRENVMIGGFNCHSLLWRYQ